jgi:hypothetical protein
VQVLPDREKPEGQEYCALAAWLDEQVVPLSEPPLGQKYCGVADTEEMVVFEQLDPLTVQPAGQE